MGKKGMAALHLYICKENVTSFVEVAACAIPMQNHPESTSSKGKDIHSLGSVLMHFSLGLGTIISRNMEKRKNLSKSKEKGSKRPCCWCKEAENSEQNSW